MIFAANLANYEKLLQQKYEVSSSIWHKGERGRQRENGLMMFLGETLPAAYGVASGEIMPFMGKKPSPQCDIIVYDRLRTPVFGRNQAVQQIPLEGVYAVIEVKSSIDAKAISDAKKKFARIKELPRCRNRVPLKKGFRRSPNYYLFGYKLATSVETCREFMNVFSDSTDVGVVALDKGLGIWIERQHEPTRAVWLNASEQEQGFHETLMYFFVSLLRDLETTDLGIPDLFEWVGDK